MANFRKVLRKRGIGMMCELQKPSVSVGSQKMIS